MARVDSYDNEKNTVTLTLTEEESRLVNETMTAARVISTYLRVDRPKEG